MVSPVQIKFKFRKFNVSAERNKWDGEGDVAASDLTKHTLDTGHPVDLIKAEAINHHLYTMTQCLLESWHIQKNQGTPDREQENLP